MFGKKLLDTKIIISAILVMVLLAMPAIAASCTTTGSYNVCTDKEDYSPEQTVHITGTGFTPDTQYSVRVTRPDSSIVTGDGSFYSWRTTYDEITTDSEGSFQYDYVLDGIAGTYLIEVLDSDNNVLATHTFTDAPKVGSVTVSPQTGTLTQGTAGSATYTITVNRGSGGGSSGDFNAKLSFITTLPTGATASFSQGSLAACTGSGDKTCFEAPDTIRFSSKNDSLSALLTISTTIATPAGTTSFTVNASTSSTDYATGSGSLVIGSLPQSCGNNVREGTEECDDGNTADGDCCSSTCQFESASTVCRASAGACDVAETCTDSSAACPLDTFAPSSTKCRLSVGVCDLDDYCSGSSAACSADAKSTVQCRASAGDCDVAESCNGVSDYCPTDSFRPNTFECRASAGACDVAETCTGSSATCPDDAFKTEGTSCDDGTYCNGHETCNGVGICQTGTSVSCSGNNLPAIATCDNTPDDNYHPTYDTRAAFISACVEDGGNTGHCTDGNSIDVINTCNKATCGAECDQNSDCTANQVGDTCNYAGTCNTNPASCLCSYTPQYCPTPGTIHLGICYYGTQSCTNSGCGLTTKSMGTYVVCDATLGPIDITPPVITKVITGTVGSNNWYISDVSVAWTVTDPESAVVIDSGCGTQDFTSETTGVTSSCAAHSEGGSASDSVNLKIDKTGPSAILSVTAGTAGTNNWYTTDVTVHTSGSDAISDSVTCTIDQYQTTETTGVVFNGACTNGAGLSTDAAPLTVKLDKTGPSANLAVTAGTVGTNGWYTSDVTVSTSGSDTISSPVICTVDKFQATETLGTDFNGDCTNDAGLKTSATLLTVKLDKTGPSAALAVTAGTLGLNGWYTSDVTVGTSGSDSISSPVTCAANQYQTTETTGTVFNGACTNDAGLSTNAAPLTVKLDKTGPSAALAVTAGTLGLNGWYTSDVTISTSGIDAISDSVICTADQSQTTETTGTIFNGKCTNNAGLSTAATLLIVKLDKNAPVTLLTIGLPNSGSNPTYVSTATIFTLGATDVISTVDKTYYHWDSDIDTEYTTALTAPGLGAHTLYSHAVDKAGNVEAEQHVDIVVGATTLKLLKVSVPSGTTPNQYSDPATVSAILTDVASGSQISGKTITFTIGTQTATATTGTDGVATTTITLTQPAGAYTVSAAFAGDSNYQSSSDSKPFTINKENVAITYTGDFFFTTAGPTITSAPVQLSAKLTQEDDSYLGDLTKAQVTFVLTPNTGSPITVANIPVSAAGDVLTTTYVPIGEYAVKIIISSGNLYWTQNPEGTGSLHVEAGSNDQRVTGGGWIADSSSANGKDNFGFTVNYNKNGAPKGNFLFMFRGTDGYDYQLKSNSWAKGGLSFTSPNTAYFTGKATLSKINQTTGEVVWSDGSYTFAVNIQDLDFNVKPIKMPDTFAITIFDSSNKIWKQVGKPTSPITLGGGNIVVHSK